MTPDDLLGMGRDALWVLLLMLAPAVLPALVIGVIVGVLQAATSINEATIAFVPKLVVTILCFILFGSAMAGLMSDYFVQVFERIPDLAR